MKLRLDLRLSQKLIMTPQLQQAIKLLQLSRLELQQTLTQHLMENPLLEELQTDLEEGDATVVEELGQDKKEVQPSEGGSGGEDSQTEGAASPDDLSPTGWEDYFESDRRAGDMEYPSASQDEFPSYDQTLAKPMSLEDHLLWQLALSGLTEDEKAIGRMIIGNLDDDGYLRTPLNEIATEAGVSVEGVESVLKHVQTFDPAGVGARDLRECLLIQLGHLDQDPMGSITRRPGALKGSLVESIVANHLKDLEKKQYGRIAKTLGVTVEEVFEATHVIEGLEPKPGRPYFTADNHVIVPDVFVVKNEGEWVVMLNDDGLPRLRISPYYKRLMANKKDDSEATKAYLEEKLRGAQWIIRSIEQRNKTIIKVVGSIVKFQEQFFEKGVQFLKPLVLKQVAEDIGMHESTISRVTANKYMYCPQGMLELKFFFNTGIQRSDQSADMLSSVTVREMIRRMVAEEDSHHPLKDQEIAARLQSHHIMIARRTVAKYRSEKSIPSASQRKRFF
ncbi:MAG: RNA polymerase factor sigma-54 [Nitrospirota bacterium]